MMTVIAMIGTDPELFLRDERTGGVVSGVGLIGGTKKKPLPMEGMDDGFALQEDNVMLEFNVPPARTPGRFSRGIQSALEYARNFIRIKSPYLEFDTGRCARMFTYEQLNNPQAKMFGCSRDYNAHAQGLAMPPPNPDDLMMPDGAWRFSGGHVHLGYEADVPEYVVGALCDAYLGLPSVALDKQGARRALYGSAGRYRPTEWGVEYRTLSNFWIWDDELRKNIGERAFQLISLLHGDVPEIQRLFAEIPWNDVQDAINNEDEVKAADLIVYMSRDLNMVGI